MKIRTDFVTNSSSSSFILHNNTDKDMTTREFMEQLFKSILDDCDTADHKLTIPANGEITLECGDHISEDGPLEYFIHNIAGNPWTPTECFNRIYTQGLFQDGYLWYTETDAPVSIEFGESFH